MNQSVSVILPVYNREHLISQAIDSVLAQTLPPLEILVVDDGSTDRTADVCHAYGNRIELIEIAHVGKSEARNEGLRRAQGDFVAFLDSDDEFLPEHLETLLKASTDADIIYNCVRNPYFSDRNPPNMPDGHKAIRLLECYRFWLPASMVRREFIHRCGVQFNPDFDIGEDLIFISYLIVRGARTHYTRGFGLDVGIHFENTTRDVCRTSRECSRALRYLSEMLNSCSVELLPMWSFYLERGVRHMKVMRCLHRFRIATDIRPRRRFRRLFLALSLQLNRSIRWQDRCRVFCVAVWDLTGRPGGLRYARLLFGYFDAARPSERGIWRS